MNNCSEFLKIVLNKIKLLSSNLDFNNASATLFMIFSAKLTERIEKNSISIQRLFKEIGGLCENYIKFDSKKMIEEPQNLISMFIKIKIFFKSF